MILRWVLVAAAGMVVLGFIVVPLFERLAPPHVVRAYQRATMPGFRAFAGFVPGWGVLETTGRRTGQPRRVPVGGSVRGGAFWLVAGAGRRTRFVMNIEADPRVRVKVRGRWRSGTACICPDVEPRKVLRMSPVNGLFVRLANREPLTLRIDLDDPAG